MRRNIGNRYLLKVALKKGIQEAIERLDSPEAADKLEFEINRAHQGGIFDDKTVKEMLDNIAVARNEMVVDLPDQITGAALPGSAIYPNIEYRRSSSARTVRVPCPPVPCIHQKWSGLDPDGA